MHEHVTESIHFGQLNGDWSEQVTLHHVVCCARVLQSAHGLKLGAVGSTCTSQWSSSLVT